MSIIANKPLWHRTSEDVSWVEYARADQYPQYEEHKRRGHFTENLLTYSHILTRAGTFVWLYVGTDDADTGVTYNYKVHDDVQWALENIDKYEDFLTSLKLAGYGLEHNVTRDAISRLQTFVDNARADD